MLAKKGLILVATCNLRFATILGATFLFIHFNGLRVWLHRLQIKVKTVQPTAKSLKTLLVAEVAEVAYINICMGVCNPPIYVKQIGEANAKSR